MSILKNMGYLGSALVFTALSLGAPLVVQANTSTVLVNAVRRAIETNPEVRASWHQFLESGHDTDSAFGGYLPSVAVNARYGFEHRNYGAVGEIDGYDGQISVTHLLYGALETSSPVDCLDEDPLVSNYQYQGAIEETTLEAPGDDLVVHRPP